MAEAFSSRTGKIYESWDELIEAESNGLVAVVIITNDKGDSWPWVEGPFDTKREAENCKRRILRGLKKEQHELLYLPMFTFKGFVRPAWKPDLHR